MNKCDFCENIGIGIPDWTFGDDELPTFKGYNGHATEIRIIANKPSLVFTNSANEYGFGYINIDYCPICGKKINP